MIVGQEKPSLEELVHSGVRGMHWGVRNEKPSGSKPGLIIQPGLSKEKEAALRKYYAEGVKSGKLAKGPIVTGKKIEAKFAAQNALAEETRRRRRNGAIRAGIILGAVGARITVRMLTGVDVPGPDPTVLEGV